MCPLITTTDNDDNDDRFLIWRFHNSWQAERSGRRLINDNIALFAQQQHRRSPDYTEQKATVHIRLINNINMFIACLWTTLTSHPNRPTPYAEHAACARELYNPREML